MAERDGEVEEATWPRLSKQCCDTREGYNIDVAKEENESNLYYYKSNIYIYIIKV